MSEPQSQFDNLKIAFPHMRPLDSEFYTEEPYKSSKIRRCKAIIFLGSLSNYEPFRNLEPSAQNIMIRKLESGCVNETIRKAKEDNVGCSWQTEHFVRRYGNLVYEKANELDWLQNTWLIPRVISGEFNAFHVALLSADEANPDSAREMIERSAARRAAKITVKVITAHECPNCLAHMCTVKNVQLRGLDESKTTKAYCLNCPFDWVLEK